MAKNVTFAHVLLMGTMLKISTKFQYPNLPCAVQPISHGPSVPVPLPPRVLETVEVSVSDKSWSDSQLTKSLECCTHVSGELFGMLRVSITDESG